MDKRRINNTLTIDWAITRLGEPENFEGRTVSVRLKHAYGDEPIITWSIEGNVIHIVWTGDEQKRLGPYMVICTENEGRPDVCEVDHCEAVELVAHSREEGGTSCSNLQVSPIQLSSDLKTGYNGLSAYEIAVKWGFVGTEQEWLASLKGEKGDPGLDGSILYPRYSVNAEMELVVESPMPTNRVEFNQSTGEIILNI